jgi:hypothetical protein
MINTKVLKILKGLDPENFVQYTETGFNAKGQRKVSHDDFKIFVQRVFGKSINLN